MNTGLLRHVFQHKLNFDPANSGKDGYEILKHYFGLTREELDALIELSNWIASHGLERNIDLLNRVNELESEVESLRGEIEVMGEYN